jgi:raffinose/stachyose/melibiose transport system substrate-binding protein
MASKTLPSRRVAAALVAGATAALLLAGCSSGGGSTGTVSDPSGTLRILVSSAAGSDAGFRAVNAAFEKQYPKVKIEFSTVPNGNYAAAEASRLTAGNVDLMVAAPTNVPSYAKGSESNDDRLADAGEFVDLSNQPFIGRFVPSILAAQAYQGKDYTVPTGVSYYTGVFYNKAIFKRYGLSIPTTWQQFLALAATLKSHGVTPLGIGGKDSWPAGLPMLAAVEGAYPTAQDKSQLAAGLWSHSISLSDPSQVAILQQVQTMYGLAQPNFAGVSYTDIPSEFAAGKFAMTPDGTWDQTTIAAAVGGKFDVGYFPLPTSDNAADNALLGGKVELRLAIPRSGGNQSAALAWLNFFTEPANYETFLTNAGFAPAVQGVPTSPFLTSIHQYTSTFQPAWDEIWTPNTNAGNAAVFPYNYTALSPMGTQDAQQAAQAAEKAWKAGS